MRQPSGTSPTACWGGVGKRLKVPVTPSHQEWIREPVDKRDVEENPQPERRGPHLEPSPVGLRNVVPALKPHKTEGNARLPRTTATAPTVGAAGLA